MKHSSANDQQTDKWISGAFVVAATALLLTVLVLEHAPKGSESGTTDGDAPTLSAGRQAADETVEVTGTIEVAERTSLGVVLALHLVSAKQTFALENNARTDELKAHVGEQVTVKARETSAPDGRAQLSVLDFSLGT